MTQQNPRRNAVQTTERLHRGLFFPECSSYLNQCILESKNNMQDLLLTTLDIQKAFDVVDHNSLLRRLYLDGIHGDDWLLIQDMYADFLQS